MSHVDIIIVDELRNDPLAVVCPKCKASISAKCTEKKKGLCGDQFIDNPHTERVEAYEVKYKEILKNFLGTTLR